MRQIAIVATMFGNIETNSVNSREIYKQLEIKQHYSDWVKQQITKLKLKEGLDFTKHIYVIGRNKVTDYIVTIDAAKNISLISFSKKGQEIRDYFIQVEKEVTAKVPNAMRKIQEIAKGMIYIDERLDKQHQTINAQNQRIDSIEQYVEEDLKSRPVSYTQQKALMDAKNQKVYEIAPNDTNLQKGLHRKVWTLFKRKFQLPRYSELRAVQFEDGVDYIRNLTIADMV